MMCVSWIAHPDGSCFIIIYSMRLICYWSQTFPHRCPSIVTICWWIRCNRIVPYLRRFLASIIWCRHIRSCTNNTWTTGEMLPGWWITIFHFTPKSNRLHLPRNPYFISRKKNTKPMTTTISFGWKSVAGWIGNNWITRREWWSISKQISLWNIRPAFSVTRIITSEPTQHLKPRDTQPFGSDFNFPRPESQLRNLPYSQFYYHKLDDRMPSMIKIW